ncbi:DNA cytosine methyltransferase [Parasedimentitalea maritima]|uniref:DNA (cytosine-5-)-methyltransferase n=1 Tax=Parasedimentitalea maritima TaxID=2578117 RepID=A0A6A4RA67_9RHOB|nr:DNA cytosine methyltransferase [Zongyanglinia marina]KAE9625121.1 DNA cytosine methyltransferase [Zongyanglinia marina]
MALRTPEQHDDLCGISLCAGVGGLDLGLHLAEPGYRTLCYVERNSFAAAALVARMADTSLAPAPIWDDLKSFNGKPWRDRVHLVSAGYPCQPFTLSGLRKGEHDPRHLWPDVARIVGEVRPEWCFFENVIGHLTLGMQDVVGDLQGMGYRVAARVQSAAEVGGSHLRQRLFILAHSNLFDNEPKNLYNGITNRHSLQTRQECVGDPNRSKGVRSGLDANVGLSGCSRLETKAVPLFPPLPHNFVEWGEVLARSPDLKPSLYGLGDGLAHGLDRAAAAGNGVVPMAAARAFEALKKELLNGV